MGCFGSKSAETKAEKGRALRRPVWTSEYPMTRSELQVLVTQRFGIFQQHLCWLTRGFVQQKREEFWDTAPHYGGDRGVVYLVPCGSPRVQQDLV